MTPADGCTLNRGAIESFQLEKLRSLLAVVLASNPFYSARLRRAGVTASVATLAEFSGKVPFTDKRDVVQDQTEHPPWGSNLTYPVERYIRFHQTSGTTASPVRWLDTAESWDWMIQSWIRVYDSAQVGPHDRVFFPFSFGPFLGFWLAFEAAGRIGALAIPGGGMRSAARLHAIIDNGATVLCSTPSYAVRLAEVAHEENIDLKSAKVRRIIAAGEPGASIPATRALIEKLWPGARVADHHGMTETGPITYECPERLGVLHVLETAYVPEVIDPESGETVGAGGTGELVLTTLGRVGSPLLRYRTGDIVKRAETTCCRCGTSELALEGGILTRRDDMVTVRGVNVYPSAVEEVLRSCGVVEFRVETWNDRALEEMSVQIEPPAGNDDASRLADRVALAFHTALGIRVQVSCSQSGTLPRFEGKARRWVRR
jgi:phenylacetate-CoA ligase